MALFTSTPKSKAGEKVSLLALDCSDDDNSNRRRPMTMNRRFYFLRRRRMKSLNHNRSLYLRSLQESYTAYRCIFRRWCRPVSRIVELANDSMKVISTKTLIDNIRYILSMSDLCDITFLVGPQRIPVYGLKSILGTRSRAFLSMWWVVSRGIIIVATI
jgi:hypothetical protein